MNILSAAFGVHETALRARSQRLELIAQNIANAETPHFKAKDVDFKAVMAQVQGGSLKATHANHFKNGEDSVSPDGVKYRIPLNASADGNTVEMSIEQANYGAAATDYRASLMFIENNTNTIKRALRGE